MRFHDYSKFILRQDNSRHPFYMPAEILISNFQAIFRDKALSGCQVAVGVWRVEQGCEVAESAVLWYSAAWG